MRERERKRVRASVARTERERGRERIPNRIRTVSTEPDTGLKLTNRQIVT